MYYYKVYCSYGKEHRTIFYRATKPIGDKVPIKLKIIIGIYKLDKIERISKEEWITQQKC